MRTRTFWRSESSLVRWEGTKAMVFPSLILLHTPALYLSLLAHREALDLLKEQAKKTEEELGTLKGILKELSENYNPNYQDMAVKAAVVGYTENFIRGEGSPDEEAHGRDDLKTTLEELQRTDLTALLMAGDGTPGESSDDSSEDSSCESSTLVFTSHSLTSLLFSISHRPIHPRRSLRAIRARTGYSTHLVGSLRSSRYWSERYRFFGRGTSLVNFTKSPTDYPNCACFNRHSGCTSDFPHAHRRTQRSA